MGCSLVAETFLNYEMRHSFCPLSLLCYSISPLCGLVLAEKVTFIVEMMVPEEQERMQLQTIDFATNIMNVHWNMLAIHHSCVEKNAGLSTGNEMGANNEFASATYNSPV